MPSMRLKQPAPAVGNALTFVQVETNIDFASRNPVNPQVFNGGSSVRLLSEATKVNFDR